jgi:outer membrane protein TolC
MKRYTIPTLVFGFVAITVLLARPAMTEPQGDATSDGQRSLAELQNQRIQIYEKIVPIVLGQYKSGIASYSDYANAMQDVVAAKLELAEKPSERVALLEEQLKLAKTIASTIEEAHRAGAQVTEADALRARAHCLSIEIRLVKERASEKPVE